MDRRSCLKQLLSGCAGLAGLALTGCADRDLPRPRSLPSGRTRPRWSPPVLASDEPDYTPPTDFPVNHGLWAPPIHLERAGRWQAIVVHHTATEQGPASFIDKIAKKRGWDGLGYDFIINNGRGAPDGSVEVGYRWRRQIHGAHCRPKGCDDNYWNEHSIGVAMIGNFDNTKPSAAQHRSLVDVVTFLARRYDIPVSRIYGHKQVPNANTHCPGNNFSMDHLKRSVAVLV